MHGLAFDSSKCAVLKDAVLCRPYNGLKVKAALDQHRNMALASFTYKVPKDGKHTQLKADISLPMESLSRKAPPQVILGIKWNF